MLRISKCNKSKGFTLIELVVTIAVLAIVSAVMATSYTNVMEDQRKNADMANLNNVDIAMKQVFLYDDAFDEAKEMVYGDEGEENKIKLTLNVTYDNVESESFIELEDIEINDSGDRLIDECPNTYEYLVNLVGEKIELTSNSYKQGYYEIVITFNGTKVSEVRGYTITNDGIMTSNSGDEHLYQHD